MRDTVRTTKALNEAINIISSSAAAYEAAVLATRENHSSEDYEARSALSNALLAAVEDILRYYGAAPLLPEDLLTATTEARELLCDAHARHSAACAEAKAILEILPVPF